MAEEPMLTVFAGLEVVKSQQVEINRRLDRIEKSLDEDKQRHVEELEAAQERRRDWVEEGIRLIATAVILTAASWVASTLFGIQLVW